jgi:chromosome segregation ATPase
MTDSKTWGGKRENSGRPPKPEHEKIKTAVIRVPENLLQTIELLKQGKPLPVTDNQAAEINRLNAEIENLTTKLQELAAFSGGDSEKNKYLMDMLGGYINTTAILKKQTDKQNRQITRLKKRITDLTAEIHLLKERELITEKNEDGFILLLRNYYKKSFKNGSSDESFLLWLEDKLGMTDD